MNLRKLREFYRISEVAEEWNCTIEDVLYLGLEGKLPLLVLVSNCKAAGMLSRLGERKPACFSLDNHMEIMRNDLAAIAARGESETRYLMFTFPDREVRDKYQRLMGEFIELDNPLRISISELWMHKNDKEYIEKLHQDEASPAPVPERDREPTYTTPEMEAMYAASREFWQNYDPARPPKKETIIQWLIDNHGLSKQMAESIDRIIRPEDKRKGGNTAWNPNLSTP